MCFYVSNSDVPVPVPVLSSGEVGIAVSSLMGSLYGNAITIRERMLDLLSSEPPSPSAQPPATKKAALGTASAMFPAVTVSKRPRTITVRSFGDFPLRARLPTVPDHRSPCDLESCKMIPCL
jgi:hypothetical protein